MDIIVAYRGIPQARGWALGSCLARALRLLGHQITEYGNYYQTEERVSKTPLPKSADLLIYCECNDLDPQYFELKSFSAKWKVYWDFDIGTHPGSTLSLVTEMGFTHVFCANKLYQQLFSAVCAQSYFLPIGVDETLYRPLEGSVKSVAVGLCGTPYPGRVRLINSLVQSGIDARLETGFHAEHYVEAVNHYQIHLNYEVGGGRGLLPGRVWETPACRTLLLTEDTDFISLFFRNKHDLITYSHEEDCLEQVIFLLSHPKEAKQIAEQGYQTVLNSHTYLHRAQSILAAVTAGIRPAWDADFSGPTPAAVREAKSLIFRDKLERRLPLASRLFRRLKRIKSSTKVSL